MKLKKNGGSNHSGIQVVDRTAEQTREDTSLLLKHEDHKTKAEETNDDFFLHAVLPSMHGLLKWPLLLCCGFLLASLMILYFTIRGVVLAAERVLEGKKVRLYRERLFDAPTFKQYQFFARKLDKLTGLDYWKMLDLSLENGNLPFNYRLVKQYTEGILKSKCSKDIPNLIAILNTCLSDPNIGGILNEKLYSQCWEGTNVVVQEYINAVTMALCFLRSVLREKRLQAEESEEKTQVIDLISNFSVLGSYGKTALFLSGGAMLATQHLGVIESLIEQRVLPKIICGTSGGAIVGAFVATRTFDELQEGLTADKIFEIMRVLDVPWITRIFRLVRGKPAFEYNEVYGKLAFWMKEADMTFLEAFNRTGITFNVTVTGGEAGGGDRGVILNYTTSPHVVIRSAVYCSAALPPFFESHYLFEKDPITGVITKQRHFRFADGSLVTDVPTQKLASLFGVRFTVTSQVNPHVVPFFFSMRGEAGNPLIWRWGKREAFRGGFVLSALELFFKEQMKTFGRLLRDLDLCPLLFGAQPLDAFLQNFSGDVTMSSTRNFFYKVIRSFENPRDVSELQWWIREGHLMAWPKLSLIIARMRIENTLEELKQDVSWLQSNK